MPSYADEDDSVDYENQIPDFQDEAEFDDYLNDEEYDLMAELFPKAKNELEDYQGWDNLAIKLAIFDNEFDMQESLTQLKRTYKKKRQAQAPAPSSKDQKGMYFFAQVSYLLKYTIYYLIPSHFCCFIFSLSTFLLTCMLCL